MIYNLLTYYLWSMLVLGSRKLARSVDFRKMTSDDPYKFFTVEKDSKSLKLKERQLTTSFLVRVFCLFSETIILFPMMDM